MSDLLYRVRDVNYMPGDIRDSLLEFKVNGELLGKVRPNMADRLCSVDIEGPPVFEKQQDESSGKEFITLSESAGTTAQERTASVARVTEKLRDEGIVRGWRDEFFPIARGFYDEPVFVMERAAVPLLGALEYGVHVNGFVIKPDGSTSMWVARRSADKSKHPSMLDHIVAGGQPAGLSLYDNVIKECLEEAGIPEDTAKAGVEPVGVISYETYSPRSDTVTRAVMFNYDLQLPLDFKPVPVDGEVESFFLWSMDEVMAAMAKEYDDPFKPNVNIVIIDFLIRRGFASPDAPGYLDVVRELRSGDCR